MGNTVRAATNTDYGAWLNKYKWDHFVTLTTEHSMSEQRLLRKFQDQFVRQLDRMAQRPISWFRAVEYSANGQPHLHVLVWANGELSDRQLKRAWPLGITDVDAYDPSLGGAYYVTKTVTTWHPDNYDFSNRLPPKLDLAISTRSCARGPLCDESNTLLDA